jgi:hypothetical protein
MNRRFFLRNLFIGAATAPALAKVAATTPWTAIIPGSSISLTQAVIQPLTPDLLVAMWHQEKRRTVHTSDAYNEAIEEIFRRNPTIKL